MIKDLRDFIFGKMFFTKVAVINKPGIIISKTSSKFGGRESKKRNIWIFEDIIVDLQLETIKELGKEKTDELWYKIGKDVSIRYMILSKAKKVPYLLLHPIIDYIFNNLITAGLSAAENIEYKKNAVILRGKDNIICRKSNVGSLMSGLVSGLISFLDHTNIESEVKCQYCPKNCRIIADKRIKKKYIPNIKELIPISNYELLNFPEKYKLRSNTFSFSDFFKFKKIWLDNSQKFVFKDKNILPLESGWIGLVNYHYQRINRIDIFNGSIVRETERIAKDILSEKRPIHEHMETINNSLCAFGWGIPSYKKENKNIIFSFVYPPITKYGFLYQALVLNGFINYIFNKKFSIKDIKINLNPPSVKIKYA